MEIICLNNYKAKYSHPGNLSLIRFFIPVVIYVIKYFEVEVEVDIILADWSDRILRRKAACCLNKGLVNPYLYPRAFYL